MLYFLKAAIIILVFFFGASVYSFLNVVVYRVPRKLSFIVGRSECTSCHHTLGALDMIPVFAWLYLGGKCRYCKSKYSPRYSLVELLGGVTAVLLTFIYEYNLWLLAAFAFLSTLTVVAFVYIDTKTLPHAFFLAALISMVIAAVGGAPVTLFERFAGIISVAAPLFLISLALKGSFSRNEIILAAVCGVFLGWRGMLLATLVAAITASAYYLLRRGKTNERINLIPFLCLGAYAAVFCLNALS